MSKNMSTDQKMAAMKKKFGCLDTNKDGNLDFDELKVMLTKGNKSFTHDEVQQLYDNVDANNDGKVSFDEFMHFIYKGDHSQNRSTAGRHGRLAAASGPVADATEGDWGPCRHTFENFAGQDMDGREFMKFCKDNKLLAKKDKSGHGFEAADVDLCFAKVVPKGKRRMDFENFKDACRLIAGKRNVTNKDIQDIVADSSGPVLKGTEAEAVRFHDDKSNYTGTHAQNEVHAGVQGPAVNRHDKMKEDKEKAMAANAADEDDWSEVSRVFKCFAGENESLEGKEFYNMCLSINSLVRGKFIKEDIDSVFAGVVARGQHSIGFEQFQDAVRGIALKKDEAIHVTQACFARSKGPTMHGTTEAEYVKFHDDKDTYTGTHVDK